MDGYKKAALFLSGLDFSSVDKVLSQLDSDSARQIRRAMLSIQHGTVSEKVSAKIDDEFLKKAGWRDRVKHQPNNSAVAAPNNLTNPAKNAPRPITYSAPKHQPLKYDTGAFVESEPVHAAGSFAFLKEWSDHELLNEIKNESSQTIAVIFANIPQPRAKRLLAALPDTLRDEVERRLADYEAPTEFALQEIASALRESQEKSRSFHTLKHLSNTDLAAVFRGVDLRTAVTALIGADADFIERVTKRLTPTEEYEMRCIAKQLGNVREKDVETARTQIMRRAVI